MGTYGPHFCYLFCFSIVSFTLWFTLNTSFGIALLNPNISVAKTNFNLSLSSGDKIKFTEEEKNKLIVANAIKLGVATTLGFSREFKTIANDATKIIKENATMRYKRKKAEQKRMNAEMNN